MAIGRARGAAMRIEIRNGRVVDPASGTDRTASVFVADGKIAAVGAAPAGAVADNVVVVAATLVQGWPPIVTVVSAGLKPSPVTWKLVPPAAGPD